ncbi:hypothetical protein [Streptomyces sp. NBC_00454]|uniref:hypothetical protein n=1 Tax=Streptomyces sp. NBC_00454 TaxID=2975747 RepID=UPI0030E4D5D9
MKLKRMTLVAAAAMVGPTLLAATPAMADDQPAVTVPDAAPKDDAAPVADPAPETAPVAPAVPVVPVVPVVEQPAAQAPAPVTPAPAAGKPAEVAPAAKAQNSPPDSMLMGPDVTVAGIPEDGFKAGGGWTPLTVTVDNSANIEVANLTPRISVGRAGGKLKAGHFKIEYLAPDNSWKSAEWVNADEPSSMSDFSLGAPRTVPRDGGYTIQVRISFSADAPVVAFQMASDALSIRPDGGRAWASTTWYETSIAGAKADPKLQFKEGPTLTLNGVPTDGFKVGGDWQNLNLHLDNSGKPAVDGFDLGLLVARPDNASFKPSHIQVEMYGQNGWQPIETQDGEAPYPLLAFGISDGRITAGQVSDIRLRVRFTTAATLGDVVLQAIGMGPYNQKEHSYVRSTSAGHLTQILPADAATGNTGNQPAPNGGAKPISDTTTQTGGELAATGSSPATTWALGGAGVALAMGAALVAGTGRRRRPTA